MTDKVATSATPPSLAILAEQRSHVLLVLSNAKAGRSAEFLAWHKGPLREAAIARPEVLRISHYEADDVDVTGGAVPKLPFGFLGIYELSIDGAERSEDTIDAIREIFHQSGYAEAPATWLYFPIGERVGRPTPDSPHVTLAYANGLPGMETEFREWYTTRHIRHALNIPALASGQCFERTQFQRSGVLENKFQIIAIYEQTGSTESIVESFHNLPPETIGFPALDLSRFAEAAYRLVW